MAKKNTGKKCTPDGVPYPNGKEWNKIACMYLRGDELEDIIRSFPDVHLTKGQLVQKMERMGYAKKKKELDARLKDHALNLIEEDKIKTNEECIRLYNSGAKVISQLLDKYNIEINKGDVPKTRATATAYNINLLMGGVEKIQKGYRVAYGMDKDGKLHEREPDVLVIEGLDMGKI